MNYFKNRSFNLVKQNINTKIFRKLGIKNLLNYITELLKDFFSSDCVSNIVKNK